MSAKTPGGIVLNQVHPARPWPTFGWFRGDVRPILGRSCTALMPYREAYIIHVACIMDNKARVAAAGVPAERGSAK